MLECPRSPRGLAARGTTRRKPPWCGSAVRRGAKRKRASAGQQYTFAAFLTKDVADHGGEAAITRTKIGLIGRVGHAAVGGQSSHIERVVALSLYAAARPLPMAPPVEIRFRDADRA